MTTFASLSDARHQKHQLRPSPFSRCRTSFPAVSGRDPPKRGPPPHQLRHSLFLRKRQVEALHSSGVTGLYQYNNPRAKRDRRGTVQERGETETDRQTERERTKILFYVRAKASRKESLLTRGGVEASTFRLRTLCSTD